MLTSGTLNVTNSTISGNTAPSGGGIYNAFGHSVNIASSTITANEANGTGEFQQGGGITNFGGTVTVKNSIVAGNATTTGDNPDVRSDGNAGGAAFYSLGYNLIGIVGTATGFGAVGDQVGTVGSPADPLLSPLANNGGPTRTHALVPGSPAIDAGDNEGAPANDQRGVGFPRVVDGDGDGRATIDIGALEAIDLLLDSLAQDRSGILEPDAVDLVLAAEIGGMQSETAHGAP